MKLLLTSAGLTNATLARAAIALGGKPAAQTKVGFIPTAANVEPGNKNWYIDQIKDLEKHGYSWIDFIDFTAPGVDWAGRLAEVDMVFVSGGNTFHLLEQVRQTGFDKWLRANLASKVYVGVSAGSIIATPSIGIATIEPADTNFTNLTDLRGLALVEFEISPHTPETLSHASNAAYKATAEPDLYGLDNNSAIQVVDGQIELVSEGEWVKY